MLIMNVIVAVSIVVSSVLMMLFHFVKNHRYKDMTNAGAALMPWLFMAFAIIVSADLVVGRSLSSFTLLLDVALGVCPIMLVSSSFWKIRSNKVEIAAFLAMDSATVVFYAFVGAGVLSLPDETIVMMFSLVPLILLSVFISYGIWRYIDNAKVVLRSGSVWHSVCLSVEYVYLIIIFGVMSLAHTGYVLIENEISVYAAVLILWTISMALSFRILMDSVLVLCNRAERRIVESLKVSAVEVPNEVTRSDTAYQEIYDRIVACFETERPYLRSDLTIDDLVKVVFSNKLYISRAISQITGRNFCQFVNYYRVMHSIETFRKNPELKVTELASLSGFNSLVSFSMAFRLYMNENPSDWIRKERNRMAKSAFKTTN